MKVELKHVRQFLAVAETLNFHRAAQALNMAQPALSRGIQALEHQLGVPLLTRNNREVSLTAAGKAFLGPCTEVAQQLERAAFRARQAHDGLRGVLTIGYTDFAIAGMLPGLLRAFRERFPKVALSLQYAATDQQMDMLEAGRLDIAFLTQPVSGKGLEHLPLQSEPLGVCLPISHPLAHLPRLPLSSLADQSWVFGEPTLWRQFRRHVDRMFLKAGFIPKIVQEAYNTDCIIGMVAAGLGITLHVANANARHRDEVVFIPLAEPEPPLITEAVWRAATTPSPLAHFVDLLQQWPIDPVSPCLSPQRPWTS
ncbi:MAG: LysR substrate-binding domain-containing protein [Lautropia sp.]|nr:LysR substrate-binding domain-containing protein [Lautropia sp.]